MGWGWGDLIGGALGSLVLGPGWGTQVGVAAGDKLQGGSNTEAAMHGTETGLAGMGVAGLAGSAGAGAGAGVGEGVWEGGLPASYGTGASGPALAGTWEGGLPATYGGEGDASLGLGLTPFPYTQGAGPLMGTAAPGGAVAPAGGMSGGGVTAPMASDVVAPMSSSTLTGGAAPGTTSTSSSILGPGGTMSRMADAYRQAMPYLAGAGLVSNLAGNIIQSQQGKSNLSDYVNATTWTPSKSGTYLSSSGNLTAGTLAGSASKVGGTIAEQMAAGGRGGGGYGAQKLGIEEQRLSELANARNQALSTVSLPPNLQAGPFMMQTNPYASTFQGIGGTAGNMMTSGMNLMLLNALMNQRRSAAA